MSTRRTVHIITGLGVGGAETMLAKLLEAEAEAGLQRTVEVICLGGPGLLADRIRATGVPVTCLGIGSSGAAHTLSAIGLLARRLRSARPDVVQCWMYHADLIGGLVARIVTPRAALIWSIRASAMPHPASLRTRAFIKLCAMLSWIVPERVISCSETAAKIHISMGYSARRITVIPNGFDLRHFVPDARAKSRICAELALDESAQILGCVARFDPQKDFPSLFGVFARVCEANENAALLLAGRGCSDDNAAIVAMIPPTIRERVKLLGIRSDIPTLTAAFDVAILTSAYGEGFPNVLGEALACGVPCVATDVGDSREIAGEEGVIAPVGDVAALAKGVLHLLLRPSERKTTESARMRARALEHYDLRAIARRYWVAQDDLLQRRSTRQGGAL
jgi:glycosyltransferase involved in cell wall biosynthesis